MSATWLLDKMQSVQERLAIVYQDQPITYGWLAEKVAQWQEVIAEQGVKPGMVVAVNGDYSPGLVTLMLSLIQNRNILVPLSSAVANSRASCSEIAEVQISFHIEPDESFRVDRYPTKVTHPLTLSLIKASHPGLVLFSSGSTGTSKGILHNISLLLEKYKTPRRSLRTIVFLLLDHIGGINTLFHTLSNGGSIITPTGRDPGAICAAIQNHRAELLPTTPTFLNLLLLSEEYQKYDLSSLQLVTYGTEVMPATTLQKVRRLFPDLTLQQTYGLSELGILRAKSRDSHSLWVKVGGEGYETKVVDGILWIRAQSAMIGYLNAPQPFDAEGWFNTQDVVEQDGEYLRILGRKSDIVNVGGQKVYPAEVESVILKMENIKDVAIRGESNPLSGNIVVARVSLVAEEDPKELKRRIRLHCAEHLESYKVPVKVEIDSNDSLHNARFKKMRKVEA